MREPRHIGVASSTGAPARPGVSIILTPIRIIVSVVRGLLEGALPLIILVCTLALFWEVLTIVKLVLAPNGFAFVSQIEAIVAEAGLVVAMLVYMIAGIRTLRGVRDRQYEGNYVESWVTLTVLTISIFIMFIPVWGTLGMAQHPAP